MNLKKTRIKDIAHIAGVSIGTVDRVLHKRGDVAENTKQKVESALKATNYTPNVMAQALKSKKSFHLVSIIPESTDDYSYWKKHPIGMSKAIEELSPFPVTLSQITFNILDEKDFQRKTDNILNLRPDGVLLAPIFKTESITFCLKLAKEKIPFVFVDGFIEETDFLAYIGEDMYQSGRVAGQLIDIITPEKSDILIVNVARNLKNVLHLKNRTNGFLNYFEKSGNNKGKKISINILDSSPDSVIRALDKEFRKNPGIRSIFITGSRSYMIAPYLQEKGLKSVHLIGYDLLDMNVHFLKAGTTKFLISQNPEVQTYKGIRKLFEYLSYNKIPEKIEYLPVDIVTSENVDYFTNIYAEVKSTESQPVS